MPWIPGAINSPVSLSPMPILDLTHITYHLFKQINSKYLKPLTKVSDSKINSVNNTMLREEKFQREFPDALNSPNINSTGSTSLTFLKE